MKFSTLATRLLTVLCALTAFAFNGDNDGSSFYLSSSRTFAPGDPELSVEISGIDIGGTQVKFRAFRVSDPVEFFMAQKDPHAPSLLAMTPPNTFDMIRMGVDKVGRDARYAARDVMPANARRAIRDVADLNSTKADKRDSARDKASSTKKKKPSEPRGDDIPKGAERYDVVAQWEHRVARDKDQWTYESVKVPIKEKGVYLIEARARGKRAITALVISEYGMVIKQSNEKALAWVTNRRSGEKVSGFDLTVARAGKVIAEKATGGDGLVEVTVPTTEVTERPADADPDEWRWQQRNRQLLVLGEKDGNFVISDPYYYGDDAAGRQKVYLHTDRPVYRPTQKVYYRGIVRDVTSDGTYETPAGGQVTVEVSDARDGIVKRDTLRVNDMGTFNGELVLGDEPPLGTYSVKVTSTGQDYWFNFAVEEYKKPEYKVEVTTDRGQYTRGDVITATVKAEYFFGSPVANAQVEYFIYRARYWRPWWRGSDWAYLYEESDDFYTYRMEMIQSQEATLNPDGTLQITVATDAKAGDDYVYRVQANVVDNSRRSISGAKSVEVTRGEFYITTRTDKYVYTPGDDAKLSVGIATFDGDRPVAAPFTVKVTRTWWDPEKVGAETEYKRRTQTIWSGAGATDAKGEGFVTYPTTQAGYFEVEVEANDGRGTSISESSYIYVADQKYANWYREGSGDVQVIPDKQSYTPGETMSALVIMPASNVDALITAEGSTLYNYSVERLTANSAIVRMPIEERFAPVFYLNATAIVNDELYSEGQRITVVPKGKMIRLEVKTDKDLYRPADRGSVMVRALDESGQPVADVDVALAMVDEAVYSIMPDATQDIQRFFYGNRWNEVSTTSSLSFNFYGDARRIAEADALMGAAGDGENQMRLSMAAPKAARNGRDDSRALAFGDVKGQMFVQPAMRKNFQDMMFWTPSVRTGSDGWAKLDVAFPDNLTTWRITARGVTRNTAVGQSISRVVARKDLLVRMETPRFLIQGDELLITTTVHNYLSSAKQTKVEFAGTNVTIAESQRTISIPANGEQRLDWRVTAPKTGTTTFTVKALTNEESDAMELEVPVLPRGLRVTRGESGELDDRTASGTLTLNLPESAEPTSGELMVKITPSLAGSLLGALDQLIGYPYGCVEQTMSRFLPTIVVAQALEQLNVPFDQTKRAQIPKMVQSGLSRLYGMQNESGGWGWWGNDNSDVFMTAYVNYGLLIARRAGFAVDESRGSRGIEALRRSVLDRPSASDSRRGNQPPVELDATTEAYALYVLSLASEGAPQKAINDRITTLARRDTINNYARALLALASRSAGMMPQATSLVTRLESSATESGSSVYWKGKGWHYNWQDDVVETTALAVNAILTIKGETDQVKRGIRWLLSQREGDAWHNTRQTAMVIYSLTDYLRSSRELDPDYSYVVTVNGREAGTGRFTRADVYGEGRQIKLDRSALRTGANSITIEKVGGGKLYTAARLSYYATGSAIQQASAGYTITREYSLLRKERQGDIYVYTKRPFSGTVRTGDEIFVKVTVNPDAGHDYFMLEDPLPAGCEVVSSTDGYTIPGEPMYDEKARQARGWYGWYWWYADRDVRDEKVAFFARYMSTAPQEFTYIMRAQIPGKYSVMPSVGALMYYPEVRGNSGPLALTITE